KVLALLNGAPTKKEKNFFQIRLQNQLELLQERMTQQIQEAFAKPKFRDGVQWPSFGNFATCSGSSKRNETMYRYRRDGEYCKLQRSVDLYGTTYTGQFFTEYTVVQNN